MNKVNLIENLEKSSLLRARDAASCLRNGSSISAISADGGPVQIDDLIETYSVRQKNLKRLTSLQPNDLHLSDLYNSVSEFLVNLKQHKTLSCVWIDVVGQPPVTYLIPVLSNSEIPLGCMAVIPKTTPTP